MGYVLISYNKIVICLGMSKPMSPKKMFRIEELDQPSECPYQSNQTYRTEPK